MDINIIRFLESLGGLGSVADATDTINEIFPIPTNVSREDFNKEKERISYFLNYLRQNNYINYNIYDLPMLGNYEGKPTKWFEKKSLEVSILLNGLQYLAEEKNKKIQLDANQSAINTNASIIATNESVQATNASIIKISKNQFTILEKQTLIFLFTGVFALGALIASVIGLINDDSKEQLQKQLQDNSKEIQALHSQLSQLKSDSSLRSEAKKASPKKN